MTQASLARILETTDDDATVTLLINGGPAFSVQAHPRLSVSYMPERLGLGDAYNRAINARRSEFVCFVHNDCFVTGDGWLDKLISAAREGGFAFPKVEVDWDEAARRGVGDLGALTDTFPPSCCYVMSREAWDKLGGFDPVYQGCHFEDTDLFMRAIKAGYKLALVPEVIVQHKRGVTRGEMAEESNYGFVRNRAIYMAKWEQPDGSVPYPSLWRKENVDGRPSTQTS